MGSSSNFVLYALIVVLVLEIFMIFGNRRYVFLLFTQSLQLMLHLPVYSLVLFPSNTLLFIQKTMKIVYLDIVEEFIDWQELFNLEEEVSYVN